MTAWIEKISTKIVWGIGLPILIGLMMISRFHHPWLDFRTCMTSPSTYQGYEVTHFSEPRVKQIDGHGFWIQQKSGPDIFVQSDTSGLILNEFIGLVATFDQRGFLIAKNWQMAVNRRHKIAYSILPVLIIFAVFFRKIRFNKSRKILIWKENA